MKLIALYLISLAVLMGCEKQPLPSSNSNPTQAARDVKWEYVTIDPTIWKDRRYGSPFLKIDGEKAISFSHALEILGKQGWELVSGDSEAKQAVFKRQTNGKPMPAISSDLASRYE